MTIFNSITILARKMILSIRNILCNKFILTDWTMLAVGMFSIVRLFPSAGLFSLVRAFTAC